MATSRLSLVSCALYTSPIPPTPIEVRILCVPSSVPAGSGI
jgi:hypothetical protein